MRVLGRNISVFLNTGDGMQIVGLSTSCSLDIQTEMIPVAGQSPGFTSVIAGRSSMTIQVDRLISSERPLSFAKLQLERTLLQYVVDAAGETISGYAYISSQSANAPTEGYATNSITMTCTGEIEFIKD